MNAFALAGAVIYFVRESLCDEMIGVMHNVSAHLAISHYFAIERERDFINTGERMNIDICRQG